MTHTYRDRMSHELIAEADSVSGFESVPTGYAVLVVKRGPTAGSRFLLGRTVTSAGRHPDSDICLDHLTVSRRHAEFRLQGVNSISPTSAASTGPTSIANRSTRSCSPTETRFRWASSGSCF